MATYRIKKVEGVAPGEARIYWVGYFDDEYYAREQARKLAAEETNPAVCEHVVCRTYPKKPPEHLKVYSTRKASA